MMNDIIIYPSKLKLFGMAILGLIFFVLSLLIVLIPGFYQHPLLFFIMLLGVLLFGILFVYAIYRLLTSEPSLVVKSAGIRDNASLLSVGFLRWDEISGFVVYDYNSRQRHLGIKLVDADAVLNRQPWWKRLLLRTNIYLTQAPINISQNMLSISVDDLLAQIEAYRDGLPEDNDHIDHRSKKSRLPKDARWPKKQEESAPDFLYQIKNYYKVTHPLIFIAALVVAVPLSIMKILPLSEAHIPSGVYLGGSVGGSSSFLLIFMIFSFSCLLVPLFPLGVVRAVFHRDHADIRRAKRCGGIYLALIASLSFLSVSWEYHYFYLDSHGIHLHPFAAFSEVHYRWDEIRDIHTFSNRSSGRGRPYYQLNFEFEMTDGRKINILNRTPDFFATYPKIEKRAFDVQPNLPVYSECSSDALAEVTDTYPIWQAQQIISIMETGHTIPLSQPWPSDWHAWRNHEVGASSKRR